MELTATSAGLLAQVFPALLIAILLEGRVSRRKNRPKPALRNLMLLRVAAVFTSVGATLTMGDQSVNASTAPDSRRENVDKT